MSRTSVSEQEIRAMDDYLKGYGFFQLLMGLEEYEMTYFQAPGERKVSELSMARMRQFEIRHFIMGMENSDEKLLLYYHYVKGESIERCGEMLGVSRTTAFRMHTMFFHSSD